MIQLFFAHVEHTNKVNEMFYIRVSHKYTSTYCSGGKIWVGEESAGQYVSNENRKGFSNKEDAMRVVDHKVEVIVEENDQ